MKSKYISAIVFLFSLGALVVVALLLHGHTVAVLEPKGLVAENERTLIFHAVFLMLIVVVPVYFLAFFFAWRYRANNDKAVYMPNWEHAKMDELVWWVIPLEIVLVLGALTWTSTHDLDPHKALAGQGQPLIIEVVALQWKWLFIYPDQNIATVNYVEFPAGVPVEFQITADAPMNSFWIPELGGQIYAMTGMITTLNVIAQTSGDFAGESANYSGVGFAHMKFIARADSQDAFDTWVQKIKISPQTLNADVYSTLAKPSSAQPVMYASVEKNLYNTIVDKFMAPLQMSGM